MRSCSGKTAIVVRFGRNEIVSYDEFSANHEQMYAIDGVAVNLKLLDSLTTEETPNHRSQLYLSADVFILCFSVVNNSQFTNLIGRTIELHQYLQKRPLLLVGTCTDLRHDTAMLKRLRAKNVKPVRYEQGVQMAKALNAVKYLECSSLTHDGIDDVIAEAVRAAMKHGESLSSNAISKYFKHV